MSHFTVLVIGGDYEGQLAPFEEQLEVDYYKYTEEELKENAEYGDTDEGYWWQGSYRCRSR